MTTAGEETATNNLDFDAEWLETDGLGGFASGTAGLIRTRRYHALLLTAIHPPTDRLVLVNGFEAALLTSTGCVALSSQRYNPGIVHSDGASRIVSFTMNPWPTWVFTIENGLQVEHQIFVPKNSPITVVTWRLIGKCKEVTLRVRPLLSGRDYQTLHRGNSFFRFETEIAGPRVAWHPYADLPRIINLTNGDYAAQPEWYRNFLYAEERTRRLDDTEDLASPGEFSFNLSSGEAIRVMAAESATADALLEDLTAKEFVKQTRSAEQRRRGADRSPHQTQSCPWQPWSVGEAPRPPCLALANFETK